MGALARAMEHRVTTYQQVWGADLDNDASPRSGTRVTRTSALGLSAVFACVRFIVDAVSTLPIHAHDQAEQSPDQPDWLFQPVPRDPSITFPVHLQQVGSSLLLDGNSYTIASPSIFNPAELRVVDPRTVEPVRQSDSSVIWRVAGQEFDWTQIIHIPLLRLAGELKGISPLEAERQTFAAAIGAEELGARFLRNGAWLSGIVEVPAAAGDVSPTQAAEVLAGIEQKYQGSRNAGKVAMLTGGATFKPLSVTPEQAQFIETRQYDDERIFRIFRVPPALAGMVREGATSNASGISQALAFEKHTIRPFITLIETAYRALLPPGQYLKFNTKGLLRGDPKTQAEIYQLRLNTRSMQVDEVRGYEDEPLYGASGGGFLSTPNNRTPDPRIVDVGALVRAGFEPADALVAVGLPPIKHTGLVPVTVAGPGTP